MTNLSEFLFVCGVIDGFFFRDFFRLIIIFHKVKKDIVILFWSDDYVLIGIPEDTKSFIIVLHFVSPLAYCRK